MRGRPRAVLMSLRLQPEDRGFHTLSFRIAGGRAEVTTVEVMISSDAQRRFMGQVRKLGVRPIPDRTLVTEWFIWVVNDRLDRDGFVPPTRAVVAGDLDDYGAHSLRLLKEMGIAA